jgi:hypothetical protein
MNIEVESQKLAKTQKGKNMTKPSTMFLLTITSGHYKEEDTHMGLFNSEREAHEHMKQFQTVWDFTCQFNSRYSG